MADFQIDPPEFVTCNVFLFAASDAAHVVQSCGFGKVIFVLAGAEDSDHRKNVANVKSLPEPLLMGMEKKQEVQPVVTLEEEEDNWKVAEEEVN